MDGNTNTFAYVYNCASLSPFIKPVRQIFFCFQHTDVYKRQPVILEGRDLIAVAQTGTGKTAAYLLPVLNKLSEGNHPEDAINCIVMSPTRELAQQIDQQMEGFSYFMPVSSVAVYGGNDGVLFEKQKKGLMLGADVVIATQMCIRDSVLTVSFSWSLLISLL